MVKQNLGKLDRVFRFVGAVWWLGPWAPRYGGWVDWLIFVIGWIWLVESFVGWCGLHNWFNINNKNQ